MIASRVLSCARASVRPAVPRSALRSVRFNSTAPKPEPAKSSSLPQALAGIALGAAGYYYFTQSSPAEAAPDALNSDEFREFTVKNTKPYNHDSHL